MSYNRLLERQIRKYLTEELQSLPAVQKLLNAVNDSYDAFERDNELTARAFSLSEQEYRQLNNKLQKEIEIRNSSLSSLRQTLKDMDDNYVSTASEDFVDILEYLKQQVYKRKEAEKRLNNAANRLTTLIRNIQAGILVEDENRKVVLANSEFCRIFSPETDETSLQDTAFSGYSLFANTLTTDSSQFINRIEEIITAQKLVVNEEITLTDGRVFERDFIPVFIDKIYKGHLWKYRDITAVKQAHRTITESEKRNRLIMNSSLDAIIQIDINGIIRFWNNQAEIIFGWHAEEVIGKTMASLIIPENMRDAHIRGIENFIAAGHGPILNKVIELQAVNRSGTLFPVEIAIVPIKENDTHLFCGFIRDITKRKKAEEELKSSEELLQFALEGAGDGIWEFNFETRIAYNSVHNRKILGYADDEPMPDWMTIIHPDDISQFESLEKAYINQLITSHKKEYRILHKDGKYRWIMDRGRIAKWNESGQPVRLVGTHTDITDRKLAEQSLKINEEKYRSIIANMNLGLLEVNLKEEIQYANNSFCEMSGYTQAELYGKKAAGLFTRGHAHTLAETKNQLREKGISDAYEINVLNKNGDKKWWLISGAPRYDDQGNMVGSIGIHLDITEQKTLELALMEARVAAEQSAAAKEVFLANMSHEIRTPMNAIIGMGRQLMRTELNNQQHFYLETIYKAADHLMVLINDILDISKIEAGKLNLEHIGFRPDDIISHCIKVMQLKAEEKGLKLIREGSPEHETVYIGDPYRLTQILLNLLSNAVKFTEKGKVTVSCLVQPVIENEQMILLTVEDTGIGIEEEFLDNIFRKFTQEDKSTARKYGGTGLGMSISKQLTELMNGEISINSKKGSGTTVIVSIPFKIGTEKDLPQSAETFTDSAVLKDKRILLVEDNEMNRLVASTLLGNYGVILEEVHNGLEAIHALKKGYFDLVLMDMQMPVMNGLDATRIIRNEVNRFIPIIALTANAIKGESEKCLNAGMNDYVTKPFNEETLINVMANWLGTTTANNSKQSLSDMKNDSDAPLYDLTILERISSGNTAFVKKMVSLFIRQGPADIEQLQAALSKQDYVTVRSVAHRMKPSIDNMGITAARDNIRKAETWDENNHPDSELEQLLARISKVILETVTQLQELDMLKD